MELIFLVYVQELREFIQPYFLRRLKSEVFNQSNDTNSATLSTKNEIIVWLKLTPCQVCITDTVYHYLYPAFLEKYFISFCLKYLHSFKLGTAAVV